MDNQLFSLCARVVRLSRLSLFYVFVDTYRAITRTSDTMSGKHNQSPSVSFGHLEYGANICGRQSYNM